MDELKASKTIFLGFFLYLFIAGVSAQSLFTESGGVESFTTGDFTVYTTGTDGLGERSLNMTGNATGLSNLESPLDVWFNLSKVGESSWQRVDAGSISSETTFDAIKTGLDPDTQYEFRAHAGPESGSFDTVTTSPYEVGTGTAFPSRDKVIATGSLSSISSFTGEIDDGIGLDIYYREVGAGSWNIKDVGSSDKDTAFAAELGIDPSANSYEFKAVSEDGNEGAVVQVPSDHPHSGGVKSFTTGDYSLSVESTGAGSRTVKMKADVQSLSSLESPLDAYFEIRKNNTANPWTRVEAGSISGSGSFSATAYNLDPGTDYEFRATAGPKTTDASTVTTNVYQIENSVAFPSEGDVILTGVISNVAPLTKSSNDVIDLGFKYRKVGNSWNQILPISRDDNGAFAEEINVDPSANDYEFKAISEDGIEGSIQSISSDHPISGNVVSFATGKLFNVSIIDVKNPVIEGEDIEVDFEVENEGAQGLGNVTLNVPGVGTNKSEYNLTQGEIVQDTITLGTNSGDAGEYTANISSDNDFATKDFNVSSLNAPISPIPNDNETVVGLNEDLSVKSNTSGVDVNIEFYLNDSDQFIGSQTGISYQDRANTSLSSIDPDPDTEYQWYALTEYNGETVKSEVYNFTTVERPEVLSIEPANNSEGVGKNPVLNATIGGNAQVNVTFHDYDKADSDFYSTTISPSTTSSYDLQNYADMGEGVTERWWLELESKGAKWNNSDDPYEFTISEVTKVNYDSIEFEEGDNMNPGKFGSLNQVFGPKTITFKVTNPEGVEMGNIGLNISNSTYSDTKFENQVGSGEEVSVDVSDKVDENQLYNITAFYQEGTTKFTGSDFTTSDLEFSSYVVELEWDAPPKDANDYVVYYNGTQSTPFSDYSKLGITSNSQNIGAANRELGSGLDECFRVTARNYLREEGNPTGEECMGGVP